MYIFSQKDNIINQNMNFLNYTFYIQDSGKFFIAKIVQVFYNQDSASACPYIKFFEPSPHQTVAQKI